VNEGFDAFMRLFNLFFGNAHRVTFFCSVKLCFIEGKGEGGKGKEAKRQEARRQKAEGKEAKRQEAESKEAEGRKVKGRKKTI
jgi:hypothetical protein